MEERSRLQPRRSVCLALLVDQQRERDSRFLPKLLGIVSVSETNRGECRSGRTKLLLVVAQLRDVLAAKDSAVVA